jgi:hypothetical protein
MKQALLPHMRDSSIGELKSFDPKPTERGKGRLIFARTGALQMLDLTEENTFFHIDLPALSVIAFSIS